MSEPVLVCESVSRVYDEGHQKLVVLNQINLVVNKGETLAIIGSSGAGKTTLLNMLGGLDAPSSGRVLMSGNDWTLLSESQKSAARNRHLGFVYQFHHLLPEFTAEENVAMPLLLRGVSSKQARIQAQEMLARVGLTSRLTHKPGELSGGERQRVAVGRALVTKPRCVLMDEPTGNLDERTAHSVQALINELRVAFETAFVIVTHDQAFARRLGRVVRLEAGSLVSDAEGGAA